MNRPLARLRAAALAAGLAALPTLAQEPVEPEIPPLPGQGGGPGDEARERMQELFAAVETRLREIDDLLYDAAAGEADLPEAADSGLAGLLEATRDRSRQVVEDIDAILELARQMGQQQQSSSGGSQPPPQSEGSPLDQPGGGQNRGREETPEAPPQTEPEPQEGPEPGSRPQDREGEPPETEPQGLEAGPPGQEAGSATERDGEADAWGELPVRVRQVFRAEGADEMPVQYRDWIDAYYRRLNRGR